MKNVITINLNTGQNCLMNADDKTNTIFLEVYGERNCSFEINGAAVASNYYDGCHMLQIPSSYFSQDGKFQIVILRNGLIASTLTFDCTNIDITSELIVVCTSVNNYRVHTQTKKPNTFPPSPHDHTWESILNKPATFPPSPHEHDYPLKVLWSGGHFMNETQTATLSENISKQPNGIVLVFSGYANGMQDDSNFGTIFISKSVIPDFGSYGFGFFLPSHWSYAQKYLYVHDYKIVGHVHNDDVYTYDGVTFRNNMRVLRKIYGV